MLSPLCVLLTLPIGLTRSGVILSHGWLTTEQKTTEAQSEGNPISTRFGIPEKRDTVEDPVPGLSRAGSDQGQAVKDGLTLWRKPGVIQNGAACATCHSPDGIELAEYAFSDQDIVRRATPHLGTEDSQRIVSYIHSLRAKLGIIHPRDPNQDRPLQPGGEVLPGATARDRDFAFGKELSQKLPKLFGDRITTIDQAKAAERELLQLSMDTLKIGIPLSRLSEDGALGQDHASMAQWLPEVPPAIPAAQLSNWYEAEDRYLENPSPATLHVLLTDQATMTNPSSLPADQSLSALKFRSLLVLQDRMRRHLEGCSQYLSEDMKQPAAYNALWGVGEQARNMLQRSGASTLLSPEVKEKKQGSIQLVDQLKQLRLSWFWMGWLSDQGLFKTSPDRRIRYGSWLSESLSKDGPYPFHNVFANARRQAVISNDPESWSEMPDRRRRIWDMAGLRSFHYYATDEPADPVAQALYVRFTDNCFRMNLYLLEDSIETTGVVWNKVGSKASVAELSDFVKLQDPTDRKRAENLQAHLNALIDAARERI